MLKMFYKLVLGVALFAGVSGAIEAQEKGRIDGSTETINSVKGSPAYAEVLLRRTELQADLESFAADYTEENPKVVDTRFELNLLTKANDRLFSVRPSELSRLTLALGKLIVREAQLEVELNRLQRAYNAEHPEVKRLKRKVDIYSASIKELLG